MDDFEKKTLETSRGYTYTYYTVDGDKSLPALFFQHGFPDHAAMWRGVANLLRPTGHPMIIPDLLGYDGTDKPTDPSEYKWSLITQDLVEIMDAEEVSKVISIGHDWGSICASRLYNYHPDRVAGVVLLNAAYKLPMREPFDLDTVNEKLTEMDGYPGYSYWYLLTAPDGPEILQNNLERLYTAMHADGDAMNQLFTTPNALREYLVNGGEDYELRAYALDPELKQEFIDRFTRDGFEAPVCWYKANTENHQYESDKDLPESVEKIDVPLLFMGAEEDKVCRHDAMIWVVRDGYVPYAEQPDILDAGHWTPYEAKKAVARNIIDWLHRNFNQ